MGIFKQQNNQTADAGVPTPGLFNGPRGFLGGIGRIGDAFALAGGRSPVYQTVQNEQDARNAFSSLLSNPEDQNAFGMLAKANPGLALQFMGSMKKQQVEPTNTEKVYGFLRNTLGEAGALDYLKNISMGTPVAVDSYDDTGQPVRQFLSRSQVTGSGAAPAQAPGSNVPTGSPLTGAPNAKIIGGKQYYQINGKWYDNPEGR